MPSFFLTFRQPSIRLITTSCLLDSPPRLVSLVLPSVSFLHTSLIDLSLSPLILIVLHPLLWKLVSLKVQYLVLCSSASILHLSVTSFQIPRYRSTSTLTTLNFTSHSPAATPMIA